MKRILIALVLVAVVVAMTVVPVSAAEGDNLAAGKSYTRTGGHNNGLTTGTSPDGFAYDPPGALTDGIVKPTGDADKGEIYGHPNYGALPGMWVALNKTGENTVTNDLEGDDLRSTNNIILDLGKVEDNLTEYVVYLQHLGVAGIALPIDVTAYSSTDGTNFTKEDTLTEGVLIEGCEMDGNTTDLDQGLYEYVFSVDASARYVKFEFTQTLASSWVFVSEVEVYAGEGGGDTSDTPSDESSADAPSDTSSADAPSDTSSAASTPSTSSAASSGTGSKPGDSSNMALYIVLAVVAVAGVAVVIGFSRRKSR